MPRDPWGVVLAQLGAAAASTVPVIKGFNPRPPGVIQPGAATEAVLAYLRSVRGFWERQGWLGRTLPFLYAQDEPDLPGQRLVARQSKVLHAC